MMPEMTRRSLTRRAPGWFFGACGSIRFHWSLLSPNRCDVYHRPTASRYRNHDLPLPISNLIGFSP